jgi:hypothetical protein
MMLMKISVQSLIIILSVFCMFGNSTAQEEVISIPDDFCITHEEYQLYKRIIDYRKENKLSAIPLSTSLSFVARLHVRDLYENRPDTSYCNLNSWSDKGPWTACCHSRFTPHPECVRNKPNELTDYSGEGHELVYWDSEAALPDTVFNFWLTIDQAKDMFLNREKWALYSWKAIGIGIHMGYASVWLGDEPDPEKEPTICKSVEEAGLKIPEKPVVKAVITEPTGRFFLIYGSFENEEIAKQERERFIGEGFVHSRVLIKDGHYRVSISDHDSHEAAGKFRGQLPEKYREAWILKF